MAILALAIVATVLAATLTVALRAGKRGADVPATQRTEQPLLTRPCPECRALVPTHEPRCHECGAAMSTRRLLCPRCGLHVGAVVKFCKRCHTRIGAETA